jgi:uncharacterized protein YcfL
MKKLVFLPLIVLFLIACSQQEGAEGKNPRNADVVVENGVVTIKIPGSKPYFRLEKVKDDSVPYQEIFFKYNADGDNFQIRTDLEDWKTVASDQTTVEMGQVSIVLGTDDTTIMYPSGTWAFP